MDFNEGQLWSTIDNKPTTYYLSQHDEYVVFWCGAVMPYSVAMNIAFKRFKIRPTPVMKESMNATWKQLYLSNAFHSDKWDYVLGNCVYTYLRDYLEDIHKLSEILNNYTDQEILHWFDLNNAGVIDD